MNFESERARPELPCEPNAARAGARAQPMLLFRTPAGPTRPDAVRIAVPPPRPDASRGARTHAPAALGLGSIHAAASAPAASAAVDDLNAALDLYAARVGMSPAEVLSAASLMKAWAVAHYGLSLDDFKVLGQYLPGAVKLALGAAARIDRSCAFDELSVFERGARLFLPRFAAELRRAAQGA